MAKENLSAEVNIQQLVEYQSFLEKAIQRINSGESFDSYITSELLTREKLELLNNLQLAEKKFVGKILEDELNSIKELIKRR